MNENHWDNLVGKRLLVTNRLTNVEHNEWTLLEFQPDHNLAKFRNELASVDFWICPDWVDVEHILTLNG